MLRHAMPDRPPGIWFAAKFGKPVPGSDEPVFQRLEALALEEPRVVGPEVRDIAGPVVRARRADTLAGAVPRVAGPVVREVAGRGVRVRRAEPVPEPTAIVEHEASARQLNKRQAAWEDRQRTEPVVWLREHFPERLPAALRPEDPGQSKREWERVALAYKKEVRALFEELSAEHRVST